MLAGVCVALLCSVQAAGELEPLTCKGAAYNIDYIKGAPKKKSLSFCKEFSGSTCCNKSHTDYVQRAIYPFFIEEFPDACRQMSVVAHCSPCDPLMGSAAKTGLCGDFCSSWYSACREGLFVMRDQMLVPCQESSVVCSPLESIVSSPQKFCELSGHPVAKSLASPLLSGTPYNEYVRISAEESGSCYDGNSFVRTGGGSGGSSSSFRSKPARRPRNKAAANAISWTTKASLALLVAALISGAMMYLYEHWYGGNASKKNEIYDEERLSAYEKYAAAAAAAAAADKAMEDGDGDGNADSDEVGKDKVEGSKEKEENGDKDEASDKPSEFEKETSREDDKGAKDDTKQG